MFRIMRVFFNNYQADPAVLSHYRVKTLRLSRPFITVLDSNQGFGRIEGQVRTNGLARSNLSVQVFKRDNKQKLWETKTTSAGVFKFRNIAVALECYVMVFDPDREKNAQVKDMIVAR